MVEMDNPTSIKSKSTQSQTAPEANIHDPCHISTYAFAVLVLNQYHTLILSQSAVNLLKDILDTTSNPKNMQFCLFLHLPPCSNNTLASLEATLVQNYDPVTEWVTGVELEQNRIAF